LYGSFAKTYKGHGTDFAIVAGLLDFDTCDERLPKSLEIANEIGLEIVFRTEEAVVDHPNTVKINLYDETNKLEMVGISIGGGTIEITELNSFPLKLSGEHPAILVVHQDRFGIISAVTNVLSTYEINIGHMEVSRLEKGEMALMVIEVDQRIEDIVIDELKNLSNVSQIIRMVV
jgi:L-serine dehydratase